MNRKTKKLKITLTIVNIIIIVFCFGCAALMLCSVLFQRSAKQDKLIFGHYLYVNTSDNLKPVINKNDIVIVKPVSVAAIKLNDFLCYYPANSESKQVEFAKVEEISTNQISLSDKAGHSVSLAINDIIAVGKATNTIGYLGKVTLFFQSAYNRISFYICVGAITLLLLSVNMILHIKIKSGRKSVKAEQEAVSEGKSFTYTLDELLEVEDNVSFEKAVKPRTEEDVLFKK